MSLKLGDHRAAAEDAENALLFDEAHVKAMLRFGEAALRGRLDPRRALARFRDARARAEELGRPRDAALAARGEARAKEAVSAADASGARADASARAGDSAPLPDHESWPDLDSAAEDALSAEATFRANPRSARFATRAAEAYVSCGAPKRALEALRGFEDIVVGGREDASDRRVPNARARRGLDLGVNADFAYARASAQWRAGDLAGAVAGLGFAAWRMQGGGGMPDPATRARMMQDPAVQAQMRQLQASLGGGMGMPPPMGGMGGGAGPDPGALAAALAGLNNGTASAPAPQANNVNENGDAMSEEEAIQEAIRRSMREQ